ncbi:4-alpha-glucanotransferase [Thermoproteota archaeon]
MSKRESGILLHITSLPSAYGIGDLGPEAYAFVDFCKETGQKLWQLLPLTPIQAKTGNSPYFSESAFAGNPLLISPDLLMQQGLLTKSDLAGSPHFSEKHCQYNGVRNFKFPLFKKAFETFKKMPCMQARLEEFIETQEYWLKNYALFRLITQTYNQSWAAWPAGLKNRDPKALAEFSEHHMEGLTYIYFLQYLFFEQWNNLHAYCRKNDLKIIGDIPIYVAYDSADVWAFPYLFKLTNTKEPAFVSGVPPDYFSKSGQLWNNPVYHWQAHQKTGFDWWVKRFQTNLELFDFVRIDHFRGLVSYWEVKAGEKTAVNGHWRRVPYKDFFNTVLNRVPKQSLIAEDLGTITPNVRRVQSLYQIPGMKVLLFAFNECSYKNIYLPHHYQPSDIVYTGTHDLNPVSAWYKYEVTEKEKIFINTYFSRKITSKTINAVLIESAFKSQGEKVIIPMQDHLKLGKNARMNHPAFSKGNWRWRMTRIQLQNHDLKLYLKDLTNRSAR